MKSLTRSGRDQPEKAGDRLFEEFLDARGGYEFTYEPDYAQELGVATEKAPDYLVRWAGGLAVCEVKHFTRRTITERLLRQGTITVGQKEEFGPVREAIRSGAKTLGPFRDAGVPLVIVLTNPLAADAELGSYGITHSILGEDQFTVTMNSETGETISMRPTIGRDGILLRERRYLSALLVVHSPDAADVVDTGDENATPLPAGAFDDGRGRRYGFRCEGTRWSFVPPEDPL